MSWTMTGSAFMTKTLLSPFYKLCSHGVHPRICLLKSSATPTLCRNSCSKFVDSKSYLYSTYFIIDSCDKNTLLKNMCRFFQKSSYTCTSLNSRKSRIIFRSISTSSRCHRNPGAPKSMTEKDKTVVTYILAAFVFMIGGAYAGVPLYKVFCQASGLGGQATKGHDTSKIEDMEVIDRQIKVRFNADTAASMRWSFRPQQYEITVAPGETALAFYTAKNPTEKPIIGISTYNVLPTEAGQYFNKIQCFCFEEQRLNPKEQVDMPVFFYIDPEFAEDPKLETCEVITLSYTFFEAKEGLQLPLPGYPQPHNTA